MPVKIVQFGDLHLDGSFAGLSPKNAAGQRARARGLLFDAVALAAAEKADIMVCTGDLFDTQTPYCETLDAAVLAFAEAGVPVFIAPGNHDWHDSKSPYVSAGWSENVRIFGGPPESVVLENLGCRVTGYGYTSRDGGGRFLEGYRAQGDGLIDILVAHGELTQGKSGQYGVVAHEDVIAAGFDYAAFGHIHSYSAQKLGRTLAVVNGGMCCRGFDEPGEKGAVVAIAEKGASSAKLVPLKGSRLAEVVLRCEAGETAAAVIRRIRESVGLPPEHTFLKMVFEGENAPPVREVEAGLSDFLAVRLEDATKRKLPAHFRAGEDSLAGLFAGGLLEKIEKADEGEKALLEAALSFGLAAIDGRETGTIQWNT